MDKMEFSQLFVIGAPRSGTTLLANLLGRTKYDVPIETHFITKYYEKLGDYGDLSNPRSFARLVRDIASERPIQQWHKEIDPDSLYRKMGGDFSYSNLINHLMMVRTPDNEALSWGDKTPHYIGKLEYLMALFPEARYVFIVRDGRDVCLSLLEKPWGPNNVFACADYWRDLNSKNAEIEQLKSQGRLQAIKYEDLMVDPKAVLSRLYEFLETDIDEEELESLCNRIKSNNFDKWRTAMSDTQKSIFESVAGDKLKEFGYPLTQNTSALSPFRQSLYRLDNKLRWMAFMFHTNIIDGFKIKFLGKQPFDQ